MLVKRVREGNGAGYTGVGESGPACLPSRRRGVGIAPDPPLSFAVTTSSVVTSVSGTVPARWTGTYMLPVSAPPPSSGAFYERGWRAQREREQEKEREREYGMRYDWDERGRRSPPLFGSRMGSGPGGGCGRGVTGDMRGDWRYVPPPPPRTS